VFENGATVHVICKSNSQVSSDIRAVGVPLTCVVVSTGRWLQPPMPNERASNGSNAAIHSIFSEPLRGELVGVDSGTTWDGPEMGIWTDIRGGCKPYLLDLGRLLGQIIMPTVLLEESQCVWHVGMLA
jgi:hypothetical protein